jgi:PIN domain nuclease of toxin-antitoxin system
VTFLLDTHVLLWWMSGNERLAVSTRQLIKSSEARILVSVASIWEILVKVRSGRLDADLTEIEQTIEQDAFEMLGIAPAHLRALAILPKHHRDPYDHLLIAQAIGENAVLITDDRMMRQYPVRLL